MRGRLPRALESRCQDRSVLEALARSGGLPHRALRRAHVQLAMAQRHTIVRALAQQVQATRWAIWGLLSAI